MLKKAKIIMKLSTRSEGSQPYKSRPATSVSPWSQPQQDKCFLRRRFCEESTFRPECAPFSSSMVKTVHDRLLLTFWHKLAPSMEEVYVEGSSQCDPNLKSWLQPPCLLAFRRPYWYLPRVR